MLPDGPHNYTSIGVATPGPALASSETNQGALERATGCVFGLRIEGLCTEGYC